jgi:hypothetical protein
LAVVIIPLCCEIHYWQMRLASIGYKLPMEDNFPREVRSTARDVARDSPSTVKLVHTANSCTPPAKSGLQHTADMPFANPFNMGQ